MRIDSHHHFWTVGRYDAPWMEDESVQAIARTFAPDDLRPHLSKHGIDRTVLVQTVSSLDETRWFLDLAAQTDFVAGVVGWVDLMDPGLGHILDELRNDPHLAGIRHQVHDEPDPDWLLQPQVLRGLIELSRRSIVYDLLVKPPQLPAAVKTAKSFPDLPLVVDHIAKPRIAENGWDDWADLIAQIAQCPNAYCKLSGMITEADWSSWKPEDLKPYIDHVLDCFGVDRLMFGSDWPVCNLAGDYSRVIEALEANLASLSDSERSKIFGENAARCYSLRL
jgi:L-fuconolactonase